MNASSTVIGLEALIEDVAAAMAAGRGGLSYRGFLERRRVVRPGKSVARWFKKVHDEIWLRERSSEWTVGGNWKSSVLLGSSVMVLMLFPRRERCSRFGSDERWRTDDSEVISFHSRFSVVMLLGNGHVVALSSLVVNVKEVSAGNREDTSAIYTIC